MESYPPKLTFLEEHILAPKGCFAPKFLQALENDKVLLVHPPPGMGAPLQFFSKGGSKISLKCSKFTSITSTLTANISGRHRDIDRRSASLSSAIHPALNTKKCELWSTNNKVIGVHVDPPYVDIVRSAYASAFEFGPLDFATRGISQP